MSSFCSLTVTHVCHSISSLPCVLQPGVIDTWRDSHPHLLPCRLLFSYEVLTPAALNFFVSYADGAVESLWSIDQYFEFVLVLMLSTGLAFQVQCWQASLVAWSDTLCR